MLRVIATGRSLFSARKVIPANFPIDYLIFSSGAGIMDWGEQKLLQNHFMKKAEVETVFKVLTARGLDFMVHKPIPDNHHFVYFQTGIKNPDFAERCELYKSFATSGNNIAFTISEACQFLVIEPHSIWIEIFPRNVSKSSAGARIAGAHRIKRHKILAIGNDYNDLDLLKWAAMSFVVSTSPGELKDLFPVISSENESDFTEAVSIWKRRHWAHGDSS
ncbi:hypothetical protein ES705_27592 [subsurface metagenome]